MAQTYNGSVATTAPAHDPRPLSEQVSRLQVVLILIGVMLGMLLAALDQTIVGTALPRIVANLGGFDQYAWVATSYLLASTVSIPIYGKLSDIYGRRPFFILGMVIFLIGSALSGTSQNMTQLIIYRGIQGLGAGAMMPIAMAIIGDIFPPSERGKWTGLITAVFGIATIIGPTLGGWITDNWGWRWTFYVNMPVGAAAILAAAFVLPKVTQRRHHKIDYVGVVLLILGAVPLLLGFSWGGTTYPWGSWEVILAFALAAVFLPTFVLVELRMPEPLISPRLFKNSIFLVSTVAMFLVAAGMFGAVVYLPLFVQDVIGDTATGSGAVLTPMMLGFMFSSIVGGQILSRTGRYKILALLGFVVASVGMFLLSRLTGSSKEGEVIRDMVIVGLGIGVMMSLFTVVVQNAFPFRQIGEVTSTLTFFRSIGQTIGVAVMGTILTNTFTNQLQSNMPKLPATIVHNVPPAQLAKLQSVLSDPQALQSSETLPRLEHAFAAFGQEGLNFFHQLLANLQSSLASGVANVFLLSFILMVTGLIFTLFLREIPLRKSNSAQGAPAPVAVPAGPNRNRALLGLTLATMAREAQQPDADPHLLATLSSAVDGHYPHDWSDEERGRAVASDILEPLSIALIASSVSKDGTQGAAGGADTSLNGFTAASPVAPEEPPYEGEGFSSALIG